MAIDTLAHNTIQGWVINIINLFEVYYKGGGFLKEYKIILNMN